MKIIVIFISLAISLEVLETARILAYFPSPLISHQTTFRPFTKELAKRGHEITVVTTDPAYQKGNAPENLTEVDLHDISYREKELFMEYMWNNDIADQMKNLMMAVIKLFDAQLNTAEIKSIIKGDKKFDLLLLEECSDYALALSHVVKAPVILMSSFGARQGQLEAVGASAHPFLYPPPIRRRFFNLTLWEKVQELYLMWRIEYVHAQIYPLAEDMLRKHFGKDLPSITELMKNVDLLILNEHPMWNNNRPVPPNVVYVGGIHQKPKEDLPEDLKLYLDSSKHGVIYMSFGCTMNTKVLPEKTVQTFTKVFSKLPYDILWKFDDNELPGRSGNIRISKWLPQSDLLYHPKVKLFITQGGIQSSEEAISAGVPLIGVPLSFDQYYNVEHYVKYDVGLQLDIMTLDENQLKNAIETVLGSTSYRENMVKLRSLLRDQPMPPLQRAVWWTEHVLRHGGARHLRAPAANMPWTQYYEIELVLTLLGAFIITVIAGVLIVWYLVRLLKKSLCKTKLKLP